MAATANYSTYQAWRLQPLKGLYYTYLLITRFGRVPFNFVKLLVPYFRPRSTWSYSLAVKISLFKEIRRFDGWTAAPSKPLHLEMDTSEGVHGVWVEPVPQLISGEIKTWADTASIKPMRIPGYWIDKEGETFPGGWKPSGSEKVVYFMHGGAYCRLSARPSDSTASLPKGLLQFCPSVKRSFSIEYRLSVGAPFPAENQFPTAIIDALAGYNYLVNTMGYSPANIIFAGDSAGGNLVLALVRYLIKNPMESLPVPAATIHSSPWTDMGWDEGTPKNPKSSFITCAATDFISAPSSWNDYSPKAYTGFLGSSAATNEYICPASKLLDAISFKGFPPTFILAGDAEILLDSIRVLRDRMRRDLGEDVVYCEIKDVFHDFINFPWFEPQRTQAFEAMAAFVATV